MRHIFLLIMVALVLCGSCFALDEAILTPTRGTASFAEEKAFNEAMDVWFSHDYTKGEKLLAEFAKKYPDSRWRAEAELHRGCFHTYKSNYSEAKTIFQNLKEDFKDTPIDVKATLRLANIAELERKMDDAIAGYMNVLSQETTDIIKMIPNLLT